MLLWSLLIFAAMIDENLGNLLSLNTSSIATSYDINSLPNLEPSNSTNIELDELKPDFSYNKEIQQLYPVLMDHDMQQGSQLFNFDAWPTDLNNIPMIPLHATQPIPIVEHILHLLEDEEQKSIDMILKQDKKKPNKKSKKDDRKKNKKLLKRKNMKPKKNKINLSVSTESTQKLRDLTEKPPKKRINSDYADNGVADIGDYPGKEWLSHMLHIVNLI